MKFVTRRGFASAMTAAAFVAAGILSAPAAQAVEVETAKKLVFDVSTRLIDLIKSGKNQTEKRAEFEAILVETAAMRDIARVALGRPWRDMSESQRDDYEDAFSQYLSRSYMDRLSGYQGEELELGSAEDAGDRGVFVRTLVRKPANSTPPLEVEWRVMDRNGPPQIFDISIEGVSLVVTQRNEFTSLLDSYGGDIDRFIARLQQVSGDEN